jgi:hypothetical protein
MNQLSGRHRRPRRTLAGQICAIAAALLAAALTFVFVPQAPKRALVAIVPMPDRTALPAPPVRTVQGSKIFPSAQVWSAAADGASTRWGSGFRSDGSDDIVADVHPDEIAGALVRPYMPPPPPVRPLIPRPRMPEGDLLQAEPAMPPNDLSELTAAVRVYLDTVGRAGGRS